MDKEDGWLFHSNSSVLTLSIHDNFPLVSLCPLNYISKRDAEELEQQTHVKKRERERKGHNTVSKNYNWHRLELEKILKGAVIEPRISGGIGTWKIWDK